MHHPELVAFMIRYHEMLAVAFTCVMTVCLGLSIYLWKTLKSYGYRGDEFTFRAVCLLVVIVVALGFFIATMDQLRGVLLAVHAPDQAVMEYGL